MYADITGNLSWLFSPFPNAQVGKSSGLFVQSMSKIPAKYSNLFPKFNNVSAPLIDCDESSV